MKKKMYIAAIFFITVCSVAMIAFADVPHIMQYQGKVTDTDGRPLNGSYPVTFTIYDAELSGTALWSETRDGANQVQIANGIFSVTLGSITPINLDFNQQCYLGIRIGADPEMTPRQKLTSVGYAFRAKKTDYATRSRTAEGIDTTEVIDAKGGLVIEARTSDPASPATGQIWLRTDR